MTRGKSDGDRAVGGRNGPTEVTVSRGDESGTNMNTACHIIWLLPSVAASPGIPSLSRRFLCSSVPYSHILDLEVKEDYDCRPIIDNETQEIKSITFATSFVYLLVLC